MHNQMFRPARTCTVILRDEYMTPCQLDVLICSHFTRRNGKEAYPSTANMSLGAAVQADSAATAQDPRFAGRPSGHANQDAAQRRQVPGLYGNRSPQAEGQVQDHLCPWIRLLQKRRASNLQGMLCYQTVCDRLICFTE